MKRIKTIAFILVFSAVISVFLCSGTSAATKTSDFEAALKETAYAYYMRGKNIQYNTRKGNPAWYPCPEEITAQDRGYLVCSAFTRNVYYDLFGVKLPSSTASLLDYSEDFLGNPEVIAFGKYSDKVLSMQFLENGKLVKKENPTTDEFLQYLKCGDIITYTGHTMLVCDLIYDGKTVKDAYVIESASGNSKHIMTKLFDKITVPGGQTIGVGSAYHLYYNYKTNTDFPEGRLEGSLHLSTIKNIKVWKDLKNGKHERYSVLRFISEKDGKIVLNYQGEKYNDKNHNNETIEISDRAKSRLKFSHLFIEKTVDKSDRATVSPETVLTYKLTVKNNSSGTYQNGLVVTEKLSEFVDFEGQTSSNSAKFKNSGGNIEWELGKLKSGEEVTLTYSVKVKKGTVGKTVESIGSAGGIDTGTVQNKIGLALDGSQKSAVKNNFDALKDKYSGKELVNNVIKNSIGLDLGLTKLDLGDLVQNTSSASAESYTVLLNKDNELCPAVLNSYFGSMCSKPYAYHSEVIFDFDMKNWRRNDDPSRRADTVYEEHFETGDILIYKNRFDFSYKLSGSNIVKSPVTYEDGEYAFIYIEGEGFVGINLGKDGKKGTLDDRNSFTYSYYTDHGLQVHTGIKEIDESEYEFLNLQTLLAKDSYVIIRPSLLFNVQQKDDVKEKEEKSPTSPDRENSEDGFSELDEEEFPEDEPDAGSIEESSAGKVILIVVISVLALSAMGVGGFFIYKKLKAKTK